MTQRENNSIKMVDGVLVFMDNHNSDWKGEDAIVESVNYLKEKRNLLSNEVKDLMKQQTGGITAEMRAGLTEATVIGYKIAKRLKILATKTNNYVLLNEVDFSKTEFVSGKFSEVLSRMDLIATRAEENLAALGKYKVKDADITALRAKLNSIIDKPAERKSTIGENVESNDAIQNLLKEMLHKLNDEMDDEVEGLIDNEEVVQAYFAVRRTDDLRGRGKKKVDA